MDMTANKENVYWKTNKEWYRINSDGEYELTEAAPARACRSFELFCMSNPSQAENNKQLKPQLVHSAEDFVIQGNTLLEYCGNSEIIDIPSGITAIRWFGTAPARTERKVVVPNTVKIIYAGAFSAARILEIELPQSLRTIGACAFSNSKLKSIQIPSGVKVIEQRTFWKCKELTDVSLSEGLEEIESFAFAECSKLQRIVIPKSVKAIHPYAFQRCYDLSTVIFEGNKTEIASAAFDSIRNLLIVAPGKTHAIKFAKDAGFRYRVQ